MTKLLYSPAILLSVLALLDSARAVHFPFLTFQNKEKPYVGDQLIHVTLGVMSKCPDALLMENMFDKVLDQVGNKVNLKMVYIGNLSSSATSASSHSSKPLPQVICKHGEAECTGNIHQLCAANLVPQSKWWSFVQCQNFDFSRIGDVSLAQSCAKTSGIEWEVLEECITSDKGKRLLVKSVKESHEREIWKSATLLINDEIRCIHDSTWKSCDAGHTVKSFVTSIEEAWEEQYGDKE